MGFWLPYVTLELNAGREVILGLALERQAAKAVVVDAAGQVLVGAKELQSLIAPQNWADLAQDIQLERPKVVTKGQTRLIVERLGPSSLAFWLEALAGKENFWAAWLLTIVEGAGEDQRAIRHILAASGPWTTPRLPDLTNGQWLLTPLNAGLGSLLIFGDDELALETAALGARAGLLVTLATTRPAEDLKAPLSVGEFSWRGLDSWSLTAELLTEIGLKPGVFVLVTTRDNANFLPIIQAAPTGWLGLAGEAAVGEEESGLFPEAVTSAQKALGLLAAMLEKN
ncbi:MAG: hypothetical protein LBT38_10230 [Deltaproteobacteria bacterium]|jgi:hypothetical protein|nr:hypothetical protein [Deltaproteobacteria bacterium]